MDKMIGEQQREWTTGLAQELAAVVGSLLGGSAAVAGADGTLGPGWAVACTVSGRGSRRLAIAVSEADAATLAAKLMGMSDTPGDEAVADTLAEVASQAAGALGQRPLAAGARIRVEGAPARWDGQPSGAASVFDVAVQDGTRLRFGCSVELEQPSKREGEAAAPAAPIQPATADAAARATPDNLEVILDIELPLTVRFGRAEMTLQSLTKIGPGSVIDLDRSPDEPVEVLINDKIIARGEVVVVAGNYGVRITEVASAADRIRTLAQ